MSRGSTAVLGVTGEVKQENQSKRIYRRVCVSRFKQARALVCTAGLIFMLLGQANATDVNTASRAELQQLKGIGVKTAEKIIQEREANGPYRSYRDLADRVSGMGDKRLAKLKAAGLMVKGSSRQGRKSK